MDCHQFPTEIWLQIVAELQQDDNNEDEQSNRVSLCQLSLTSHYFQSLVQPTLFSKLELDAGEHTLNSYAARTKERLKFISSPRIAGAIKMINVRERKSVRTRERVSDTPTLPSESDHIKALSACFEHFHNLIRVKLDSCYLSSTFFRKLFTVRQLESLTIGNCDMDAREFGPEMEAMPSFQLRKLTIQSIENLGIDLFPIEWWPRFLSPHTLEKLEMRASQVLMRHIATSKVPFASLRRFKVSDLTSNSSQFLKVLSNLPSLEYFSGPARVIYHPENGDQEQFNDDIPPTIVPRLKHIAADWYYIYAFLNYHPSLRSLELPLIPPQWEESPAVLKIIKGMRPEITALVLTLSFEVTSTEVIKVALTELPSLETFTVKRFIFRNEIVDEIKEILLKEDLTPTLHTVNIGYRNVLWVEKLRMSEEVEEKLRNHPNMQIVNIFRKEYELSWKR